MLDELIIFAAKYLVYVELAGFVITILLARRRVRIRLILITLIAFPTAYILSRLASYAWYDTRPFVESGLPPLIAHAADNGFPSDHMLIAATMAAIVTTRYPRVSILFWLAAIAIGTARVLAHVHHVTDILASAFIGILSVFVAYYLVIIGPVRKRQHANSQMSTNDNTRADL